MRPGPNCGPNRHRYADLLKLRNFQNHLGQRTLVVTGESARWQQLNPELMDEAIYPKQHNLLVIKDLVLL